MTSRTIKKVLIVAAVAVTAVAGYQAGEEQRQQELRELNNRKSAFEQFCAMNPQARQCVEHRIGLQNLDHFVNGNYHLMVQLQPECF